MNRSSRSLSIFRRSHNDSSFKGEEFFRTLNRSSSRFGTTFDLPHGGPTHTRLGVASWIHITVYRTVDRTTQVNVLLGPESTQVIDGLPAYCTGTSRLRVADLERMVSL